MLKHAIAAVLLALLWSAPAQSGPNWTPPPAKEGYKYPDCYCTNRGERVALGGYACLRIGSREVLAKCGMSVNNPAWRTVEEGCPPELQPGASLLQRLQRLQPG